MNKTKSNSPSATPKLNPRVFLLAAQDIDNHVGTYSCCAISGVRVVSDTYGGTPHNAAERRFYIANLLPHHLVSVCIWGEAIFAAPLDTSYECEDLTSDDLRSLRVLLLLMAYQMARNP